MIEATEEMKAMARRVAKGLGTDLPFHLREWAERAALAAIIEATEKNAELVEGEMPMVQCMSVEPVVGALQRAAAAIRSGNQYGKAEG